MEYNEKFEDAFNLVAPNLRKLGVSDNEIRFQLTNLLKPTPKETGDMARALLEKLTLGHDFNKFIDKDSCKLLTIGSLNK